MLDERKQLVDNVNAYRTGSKQSLANADDRTKVLILEEQLR